MSDIRSFIDELEDTMACGSAQRRLHALQRVTDLFVAGSRQYSGEQVALFDDVLLRLAAEIEVKARAKLAERLAPIGNAPRKLIRVLAFDDAIEVATPVLMASTALSDRDLIEAASTKSQDHLYAIAHRPTLNEDVTDVLVERGERRVVLSVARNPGARISDTGFGTLVSRARDDDELADSVGRRRDIPRPHFLKLLETASASVRAKLEAASPEAAAAIKEMVADVCSTISSEVRDASPGYKRAAKTVRRRQRTHQLSEATVHAAARSQHFERTVAALTTLGHYPVDLVERALLDDGIDMILILLKAAGCSRLTAKSILLMHVADRGMSEHDLQAALATFERLSTVTAKRVIAFHDRRRKRATDTSPSPEAPALPDANALPAA
jgi:uncharacterized protein (DUF2336 family)